MAGGARADVWGARVDGWYQGLQLKWKNAFTHLIHAQILILFHIKLHFPTISNKGLRLNVMLLEVSKGDFSAGVFCCDCLP